MIIIIINLFWSLEKLEKLRLSTDIGCMMQIFTVKFLCNYYFHDQLLGCISSLVYTFGKCVFALMGMYLHLLILPFTTTIHIQKI
jgi:DMSO/TMAO reductase YedYZ heme-binding membrane subunit